jgi:group I intron endonuclease
MPSGIYRIINFINGKFYVGSATYLRKRLSDHKCSLIKNQHVNQYLQNAWNKYGAENFHFEVLEYCIKEILVFREQYWIDKLQSANDKFGYNMAKTAGNTAGIKWTEEQRAKYLAKRIGSKRTQEEKDKISLGMKGIKNRLGTKDSIETREKKRNSHGGRKLSEQAKQKLKDYHETRRGPIPSKVLTISNGEWK